MHHQIQSSNFLCSHSLETKIERLRCSSTKTKDLDQPPWTILNGLWTNSVAEIIRSATCTVTFSGSQVTTKRKQREFGRFLQGELPERLLNYSRRSIEADDLSRRGNASLTRAISVHEGKRETKTGLPVLSTTLRTGSTARRKLARSRKQSPILKQSA